MLNIPEVIAKYKSNHLLLQDEYQKKVNENREEAITKIKSYLSELGLMNSTIATRFGSEMRNCRISGVLFRENELAVMVKFEKPIEHTSDLKFYLVAETDFKKTFKVIK